MNTHIQDGKPVADAAVLAGQAAYHKRALNLYDLMVFYGSAPFFWRCPASEFRRLYDVSVGAEHMEIGVGTGYLLTHCRFPVLDPRITLVDLNPDTLVYTARQLSGYRTEQIRANALEPLPVPRRDYDSVGISFLLHCMPGSLHEKGVVLGHAASVVRPGGVVFGSTVLSSGVPVSYAGRKLMGLLNSKGIFHNEHDDLDSLREQLEKYFVGHELITRGSVALFRAWTPVQA
ncbi:class I SAM-dependent methyltransferase [Nocardia terpenica]|uniref:Methyltransferase n=1 Tax=Nocardia terpenica TaxID=455432 RepID=A0A6G9Z9U7_9NOCA|nr:class I SAM-dependent methyltransferase [Nocardia terpenica]QIS22137.1 methyltransferase [Nocardia terpenica]